MVGECQVVQGVYDLYGVVCRLLLEWIVDRVIHDEDAINRLGVYLLEFRFLLEGVCWLYSAVFG